MHILRVGQAEDDPRAALCEDCLRHLRPALGSQPEGEAKLPPLLRKPLVSQGMFADFFVAFPAPEGVVRLLQYQERRRGFAPRCRRFGSKRRGYFAQAVPFSAMSFNRATFRFASALSRVSE